LVLFPARRSEFIRGIYTNKIVQLGRGGPLPRNRLQFEQPWGQIFAYALKRFIGCSSDRRVHALCHPEAKDPSPDPKAKRLAVAIEEHPLDFGDFGGTTLKGEYGGGTSRYVPERAAAQGEADLPTPAPKARGTRIKSGSRCRDGRGNLKAGQAALAHGGELHQAQARAISQKGGPWMIAHSGG
jgi:hypothetical protein